MRMAAQPVRAAADLREGLDGVARDEEGAGDAVLTEQGEAKYYGIVMELLAGGSLAERIARVRSRARSISTATAKRWLRQIGGISEQLSQNLSG